MDEAEFTGRIQKIRARFASRLTADLDGAAASPALLGGGGFGADAVAVAYRRFHNMAGIAATLGFDASGRVAREIGGGLRAAFQDNRGLSPKETVELKTRLEHLRVAALIDLRSTNPDQELAS